MLAQNNYLPSFFRDAADHGPGIVPARDPTTLRFFLTPCVRFCFLIPYHPHSLPPSFLPSFLPSLLTLLLRLPHGLGDLFARESIV